MITERDLIQAKREAFALGSIGSGGVLCSETASCEVCRMYWDAARAAYPMPQRPREIEVTGSIGVMRLRIRDGVPEYRSPYDESDRWVKWGYDVEAMKAFGELAANPTEDGE